MKLRSAPPPSIDRIANCERMIAALVALASPEGLRKAIAENNTRTALSNIGQLVRDGHLVPAQQVTSATVAVQVKEMLGDACATPAIVLEMATLDEKTREAFVDKKAGERINPTTDTAVSVHAVLEQCWDRVAAVALKHKSRKRGQRRGR